MLIKIGKIHIEDPDPKQVIKALSIILVFILILVVLSKWIPGLIAVSDFFKSIWKWIKHLPARLV